MALREFQSRGGILNHVPEIHVDVWKKTKSVLFKTFIVLLFMGANSGIYVSAKKYFQSASSKQEQELCDTSGNCLRQSYSARN